VLATATIERQGMNTVPMGPQVKSKAMCTVKAKAAELRKFKTQLEVFKQKLATLPPHLLVSQGLEAGDKKQKLSIGSKLSVLSTGNKTDLRDQSRSRVKESETQYWGSAGHCWISCGTGAQCISGCK
jgi:hypothetical protein